MSTQHSHSLQASQLGSFGSTLRLVGLIVGLIAMGASYALSADSGAFIESYLTGYALFLQMSLGGLFFVLLQHCTRSGWSVLLRRIPEAMAMNLVLAAVLLIPVLANMHHLYHWTHLDVVAADPILQGKAGYLNNTFFLIRMAIYFVIWIGLAAFFFRTSKSQDKSKDPKTTLAMEKVSYIGMILFTFTINYCSYDLLMSLDPHWFSTMYGVYFFSGAVVSSLSMISILVVWWRAKGLLPAAIGKEHLHDLGKLLFAFVVFWAYISFSQYMLIWYADLPEETGWILLRQEGDWGKASMILIAGHFVIPFLFLLSRWVKRSGRLLVAGSAFLIVMSWFDCWWLVMPSFRGGLDIGAADILIFVSMIALFLGGVAHWLSSTSLVPIGDPRLDESLHFHNI